MFNFLFGGVDLEMKAFLFGVISVPPPFFYIDCPSTVGFLFFFSTCVLCWWV